MNGIVVMDCVQTAYHGKYDIYGTRDRLVRISGRRAAAVNGSGSYSHESFADCTDSPQHGYNPETASLKKTASKKTGSKRFVTKKNIEMAAGSKNSDIKNRQHVKASEKVKSITGQKDNRTIIVRTARFASSGACSRSDINDYRIPYDHRCIRKTPSAGVEVPHNSLDPLR